jgi:mono/diheme cytochrome c family protein
MQTIFRKLSRWVLIFMLVASWTTATASPRVWTDATGNFKIEAEFVDLVDGNVLLKKTNGGEITVPFTALSLEDQTHIQGRASESDDSYRTWTDVTGKFQIHAQFLQISDGNVQLKRKTDAKVIVVPLSSLSQEDQVYLQKQAPDDASPAQVNSLTHVKAILEENCIRCHGQETQKGGLRLDSRGAALGGGDSGNVLVPGNAAKSLIYQLIILDKDHLYRMPPKGPLLTPQQQLIIKEWIDAGAEWPGQLQDRDPNRKELAANISPTSYRGQLMLDPSLVKKHSRQVDTLMDIWFSKEGQSKNPLVSDELFLRRAYLDICGRIPSLPEYEAFMRSTQPDKRDALISDLLNSPAFVSHTYNLWLDALRVKQTHLKFNSDTYMVWIQNAIRDNMPYDEFVREQLSAQGHVNNPETAAAGYFIRDRSMPEDRVATTMQLFLGTSMACAQCHDHPSEKWTQMDFYKLYAFFNGTIAGNGGTLGLPQAMTMAGARKKGDFIITPEGKKLPRIRTEHHYKPLGDGIFIGGYGVVPLPASYKYDDGKPNQMIKADVPFSPEVSVDYEDVQPPNLPCPTRSGNCSQNARACRT